MKKSMPMEVGEDGLHLHEDHRILYHKLGIGQKGPDHDACAVGSRARPVEYETVRYA